MGRSCCSSTLPPCPQCTPLCCRQVDSPFSRTRLAPCSRPVPPSAPAAAARQRDGPFARGAAPQPVPCCCSALKAEATRLLLTPRPAPCGGSRSHPAPINSGVSAAACSLPRLNPCGGSWVLLRQWLCRVWTLTGTFPGFQRHEKCLNVDFPKAQPGALELCPHPSCPTRSKGPPELPGAGWGDANDETRSVSASLWRRGRQQGRGYGPGGPLCTRSDPRRPVISSDLFFHTISGIQ